MLFNSLEFIIFLPIVFLLYWYIFNRNVLSRNLFIIIVSYLFYGWWDWKFLLLIAFTSLCSFISGVCIERIPNKARIMVITNIIINLFILGLYKYYDFFVESFHHILEYFGIQQQYTLLNLILPVGISFYTFQALSYTIDVYRKNIKPTHDIFAFFAYVSFFPQLVAGPIERATNLLPQFYKTHTFNYTQAVDGMRQILWGFFKKVVVADNCAVWVNEIFANYQDQSASTLLLGGIYFAFQIYGDFSGYSDIAIGTAKLFGINLMRNFNLPYFSRDIAEFWRRWHISLTTWFRDYIYIPLGGSRVSKIKVIRNTFIIFLVSGMWHGANWTFIIWGLYHACLFIPLLLMKINRKNTNIVAENHLLPSISEITNILLTFILVVIGWIIFRAENITIAFDYIHRMFDLSFFTVPNFKHPLTILSIVVLIITEWLNRTESHTLYTLNKHTKYFRYATYFILALSLYFCSAPSETFIYFQF